MSFSCGKDSILALHQLLAAGHTPVCLISMLRADQGRSWFHGADRPMLEEYGRNLGIPLIIVESDGENYAQNLERTLIGAKNAGATAAVFGDIDFESNRQWEEERCRVAGIDAVFPLWGRARMELLSTVLGLGYKCVLKNVAARALPLCDPGGLLDLDTAKRLAEAGLDPCGENGEYHTLVVDGPLFKRPMPFKYGETLKFEGHSAAAVEMDSQAEIIN